MAKDSVAVDVNELACSMPSGLISKDARPIAECVPEESRVAINKLAQLVDFSDSAAASSLASIGEELPSYDQDQVTQAFHPSLLSAHSKLISTAQNVGEIDKVCVDNAHMAALLADAESQHEVLMELRAGALENDKVTDQGARVGLLRSENVWKKGR